MTDSMFDITGKVALVTGASSGLGAHFARVLAARGAKVVLAARRIERLKESVVDIESHGGVALAVQMDVTQAQSVKAAFDEAEKTYGLVQIVANNAGVADAKAAVYIEQDSWDFVLDTNLKGVWLVAKEAGQRMIHAESAGSIVNTASILGLRVANSYASYSASKAAVIQLTKSLALEWSQKNIRVNALCPGFFETEINSQFLRSAKGKALIARSPACRTGQLDELTAPFLLLATQAGSFVNGISLPVDGACCLGNM